MLDRSPLRQWIHAMFLLLLALLILSYSAFALANDDFLAPEQAFQLHTQMVDQKTVEVSYVIAPGYYMYRERFAFHARKATLGIPEMPKGVTHYDDTFAKDVESYRSRVAVRIPVAGTGPFVLEVTSQGCADKGLCYPPMTSTVQLDINAPASTTTALATPREAPSELGRIETALHSQSLTAILPLFFVLGLGLAFTPCVLPMLPILSSIVVGSNGDKSRTRRFALSLSYSTGMAIVYTLLGVAAGLAGEGLAAALQNAWVLGSFAALMAVLSLSMFGVFQLQMPARLQQRLIGTANRQVAGTYAGVFVMGALSALIVGPCVAAPLAGALLYISKTGNAMIGASALFAMAAGMSVPLLLIGASVGRLLPRTGPWMVEVKRFFGVLMLATAVWIIGPVITAQLQMAAIAALAFGYALVLFRQQPRSVGYVASSLIFGAPGLIQLAGLVSGGSDPLAPLARSDQPKQQFRQVRTVAELETALLSAQGKIVMLDFYADWCVSCKEMEKFTFADARVARQLNQMVLLQVDVTKNNSNDKAMLKRFNLYGPPGIIFFAPNGQELSGAHVIGYQNADKFLESLSLAAHKLSAGNTK